MALIQVIVIASLLQYLTAGPVPNHDLKLHEDTGLNTVELITKYGYPVELHDLVTEDGYILTMQRISHGRTNTKATKSPVLVMHGLLSSGADFVNMGLDNSLGFLLAEAGYDVWLGNARGTTWSRNHTTLDPNGKDFWRFSWNEIGVYDLTAKIDYILQATGEEQVQYIGHSQGTTSFYAMASQKTEYNAKISLMVSLAPVAYMSHLLSPIFLVASQFHTDLEWLLENLNVFEFLPNGDASVLHKYCDEGHPYRDICASLLFLIAGYNHDQLNPASLPVIMTNAPAGSSTRQLIHYAQGIQSGYFRLYDFGAQENLDIYGQEVPPDYDISQITAPVSLFYSANDWCAAEVDVEQLASELGNLVYNYKIEDPRFNHIDFLWAMDVVPLLYSKVLDLMDQY